jgi:hypothetical protein
MRPYLVPEAIGEQGTDNFPEILHTEDDFDNAEPFTVKIL